MTDEIWDYIYSDKPYPANSPVPQEKVDALKREYNYWYPMDVRSSGKDLINNHLSFCIFVHAALFPEEKWPLSMRANGHLLLNGKKMFVSLSAPHLELLFLIQSLLFLQVQVNWQLTDHGRCRQEVWRRCYSSRPR